MDGGAAEQRDTLAAKLNRLFSTVHPPNRGPYSNEEVAAAICSEGGPSISGTYIWYLRKGERDNPTKKHLEALAAFFGVPPAYFFDDTTAKTVDEQLELLSAIRTAGVEKLALRAIGLSRRGLKALVKMVESARELEGLPPAPPYGKRGGT